MNDKGFTSIILILFILVFAGVAGYLYLGKNLSQVSLPTPRALVTPTPTNSDETDNWKTAQTTVDLELRYPSNWFLEESGSSQFPTVRIQNYPIRQTGSGSYNKGEFYLTIQRFPVGNSGIHSQEELINRLPKDGDSFMYIGSSEKLVIYKQENIKISRYLGVHRVYGIASSPDVKEEIYYVLNPNGSVIQVEPKLDVSSQKQIFDQILSTFKFL